MLSKVNTMSLEGIKGYLVEIQCDVSGGLPCFDIVGLPDTSLKESRERVQNSNKKLWSRISKQKNSCEFSSGR